MWDDTIRNFFYKEHSFRDLLFYKVSGDRVRILTQPDFDSDFWDYCIIEQECVGGSSICKDYFFIENENFAITNKYIPSGLRSSWYLDTWLNFVNCLNGKEVRIKSVVGPENAVLCAIKALPLIKNCTSTEEVKQILLQVKENEGIVKSEDLIASLSRENRELKEKLAVAEKDLETFNQIKELIAK